MLPVRWTELDWPDLLCEWLYLQGAEPILFPVSIDQDGTSDLEDDIGGKGTTCNLVRFICYFLGTVVSLDHF